MTENRELGGQLGYLERTLRKLLARTAIRRREQWHIVFVPLTEVTGLDQVHFMWGAVFPLEALSTRYREKNCVLWDCDAAPTALYDILDLIDIVDVTTSIAHPEWDLRRIRPGIMVVSERVGNVNGGIVYLIGNPPGTETEDWMREGGSVEDWRKDIDNGRLAMLNTVDLEGMDALWDQATNAPYDLDIPDVLSRVQDWQQKARQASGDPHFVGKYARTGADYAHLWAMYGLVINKLAHGIVDGQQRKGAFTAHLPEEMSLIAGLGKWAGPFYEQGILKLLDGYQSEGAYYGRLPGEFCFMHNVLAEDCIDLQNAGGSEPSMMPPVNVHGFSDKMANKQQ
ncbi:unnamed protein product [Polarella glacialis]|uniref:Uncharacterized protein n=1 Tax=Polarella glacialis TaxID=89957 RepID=A0A813JJT3_POLGL|nr:unnamed protein product [Polarella glacialis]